MEWRTRNSLGSKCKGPFFKSYSFVTTASQKCRCWVICIVNHKKWHLKIRGVRVNFLVTWWRSHVRFQGGYLMTYGYVTTVRMDCITWYQDGYLRPIVCDDSLATWWVSCVILSTYASLEWKECCIFTRLCPRSFIYFGCRTTRRPIS